MIFGKKGQLLFKDVTTNTTRLIDKETVNEVRELLSLRKAS